MRAKPVLVVLAAVAVVVAVIAAIATSGSDGGSRGDGDRTARLPAVEGTEPPTAYRIVYRVTTPDDTTIEERVVHRPFGAHVIQRTTGGQVTAERWSDLGGLVTRSQGAPAVRISTAVAPSASDVRPDRFADALAATGRLVVQQERIHIGGRSCRLMSEAGRAGTVSEADTGTVPVLVSRCVDDQGLVLEERYTTPDGGRVLTKRAIRLDLGDDVPEIEVPDAEPLSDAQGNGAVRQVADDEVPPFAEAFALAPPADWTFVGRYAVVPARITGSTDPTSAAGEVAVALYTDVWRRGPDVLLLDQGAVRGTSAPFDPETRVGDLDLGALGPAELATDLRLTEVRLVRPDDGFVRLAGTLTPDELTELARSLQLLQEAPR